MWNVAQVNIGRITGLSMEDPVMEDFVNQLEKINQLAENSKGFVWRLKEDSGDATHIKYSPDPRVIVNMSVWESIDDLAAFTYKTIHRDVLAKRARWFEKMTSHFQALWYIPRFSIPSIDDARFRLAYLEKHGPSPMAFTFSKRFDSQNYIEFLSKSDVAHS